MAAHGARPRKVRPPAVAGSFYPADPETLRKELRRLLAAGRPALPALPAALIVPHAGYAYSGPVAAKAYATLAPFADRVARVALFGPAHFVPFEGMALPEAEAFETPLGVLPVDRDAAAELARRPGVRVSDAPHAPEHALEVQLPFLQAVLGEVPIVPVLCGDAPPDLVARAMESLAALPGTLLLVSTDLSHYLDWAAARRADEETARAVEALAYDALAPGSACGRVALAGLLAWAQRRRLHPVRLDLRNSGDTAGGRSRVVGYGAWAFLAPSTAS